MVLETTFPIDVEWPLKWPPEVLSVPPSDAEKICNSEVAAFTVFFVQNRLCLIV